MYADPLTSSTGRCILRKFLRSPFSISSIMSRAGCPSETTPSNRTTWLQEKALVTENSPKNETQCTLCVKECYNNLTTTLYQYAAIPTILVLALRSKEYIKVFWMSCIIWSNISYFSCGFTFLQLTRLKSWL